MNRSAGYTLIEVLIMLAVTAILAATVLETVRASTANGVRIEQAARNATQDYISLASVRRAVEASRPDYNDGASTFSGNETQFSALTSYPITSAHASLQAYSLSLVNDPSGVSLVYEDQGGRFPVQFWPEGQGRWTYLGEVSEARIGFVRRTGEPRERDWTPDWPVQTRMGRPASQSFFQPLPLAARAEIELANGQRRVIIFQLPVTASPRPRIEDLLGTVAQ